MAPLALVFDAYGTLYDVHAVVARCEEFWPGRGAELSLLWRTKQLEYTWQRSLMRRYAPFSQVTLEALQYACAGLGLPLEGYQSAALLQEYRRLAVFPEVAGALARFATRKAILSNGSPDMLDPLVKQSGLAFDAVLSVDALKLFKPAPEVYQLAVDRLGVVKEAIGFVSSNCWDALGAKAFGFRVWWINRLQAPVDALGLQPDAVVGSLDEILL
ncbi:MAG TPA: haloacid dehalogenase type II [Burkholderiales bacterium]|nr:haloacid dehalogenase type II [Burkholderiales bacterium]